MKNKRVITGLLICMMFMMVLSGCSEKGRLKINFKKGDSYKVEVYSNSKSVETVSNKNIESNQTEKDVYIYKVVDVDKDGTYTINSTIKSISFKYTGTGGTLEYDSSKDIVKNDFNSMIMTSFIGRNFTIKITPTGEVKKVTGFDELINSQVNSCPFNENYKTTERNILNQFFSKDALKEQIKQMFNLYPDKKVNVGDKWNIQTSISSGVPVLINSIFQLKNDKNGVAEISENSKINTDGNEKVPNTGGVNALCNASGNQSGTIRINEDSGLIIDREITQKITGTIGLGGKSDSQSIPINTEVTASCKMSK